MFVGVVMCHISTYSLLSAYCRPVYRYKRMRLLTTVYGIPLKYLVNFVVLCGIIQMSKVSLPVASLDKQHLVC